MSAPHMKQKINKLLLLWMTVIYKDQYGSIIHQLCHELLWVLISITNHELVSVIINFGSNFDTSFGWNYGRPPFMGLLRNIKAPWWILITCTYKMTRTAEARLTALTGLSLLVVTTPWWTRGWVRRQPSLLQDSHFSALQEAAPRLTNGEDSRGTGQHVPANYANKWRSPPVMAGAIWKSGADSSQKGESLGVITVVWREVEGKMLCSLILVS